MPALASAHVVGNYGKIYIPTELRGRIEGRMLAWSLLADNEPQPLDDVVAPPKRRDQSAASYVVSFSLILDPSRAVKHYFWSNDSRVICQ